MASADLQQRGKFGNCVASSPHAAQQRKDRRIQEVKQILNRDFHRVACGLREQGDFEDCCEAYLLEYLITKLEAM
jgi:hypothetical protein